jgi:hypothetical protein
MRVLLGGFLEVIVAVCVIGTGVTLYPVIRSQNPGIALGHVAGRLLEATFIVVGIVSILSVVTLRQGHAATAGADDGALVAVAKSLVALHGWTFLLRPGIVIGGNTLMLAYGDVPLPARAAGHRRDRGRQRPRRRRVGDRRAVRRDPAAGSALP